ncbi:MAG: outer membrane protein transport protein [Gammaproteobacteria bacterium]|nr:outer membrane protein transport protein [Gammaproteobacteria bacterium]
MKFSIKVAVLSAVVTSLTLPYTAYATNGGWLIGFGAKSRAMGGTGVADNRGGLAAAFNPATMVDSGRRFDVGADLFSPPRRVKHNSTTLGYTDEESEGKNNIFLIPNMGGSYQWKENLTVGFSFIGAGLQTEYNQSVNNDSCTQVNAGNVPGFAPGSCPPTVFNVLGDTAGPEVGVELIQMQLLPSIAYRVNKNHSIGATVALAATYFRAKGLEDFDQLGFTSADGDFTSGSWDSSYGVGLRLGWLGTFVEDRLRFGLNYSSRIYMQKHEGYKNLFAEQGTFDIPESYSAGIAFDFTPAITATLDVQRINWHDVRSIGNPGPNAADPNNNLLPLCPPGTDQTECLLGGNKGLGFGWTNQNVYKFGIDWAINEKWNARAGWNYAKSPIPDDQVLLNFLAPATPEHHVTLGGGYAFNDTYVLDASLVYAFSNTITGPTAFGPGGATVTGSNASIDMTQLSVGVGLGIKF